MMTRFFPLVFVRTRQLGLMVAAASLCVDALTKALVLANVHQLPLRVVDGFLNFTFAWNRGMSFSLFHDVDAPLRLGTWELPAEIWVQVLLGSIAVAARVYFVVWLGQRRAALHQWGLGLVIGGALGNLVDRIQHGAVVDFIHVYYQNWHFPVFNVADSCITLGVALLLLDSVRQAQSNAPAPNKKDPA